MNVAVSLAFVILATLGRALSYTAAADTVGDGISHPSTRSSALTNWTICGDPLNLSWLEVEPRCSYVDHDSTNLLAEQTSLFDPANSDPFIPPLLTAADTHVCQAAPAMLPLLVPHRNHPPRPASSAVISVSLDGKESSSPLAAILRSCSLWELVSLASAVAWLFVCLVT